MDTSDKRLYGVSAASLIPWSWGPFGPITAPWLAEKAGFDGIQALPIRGWGKTHVDGVISYEDAWNYGNIVQVFKRHVMKSEGDPTILDWIMFGREFSVTYPNALYCSHEWTRNGVCEMYPGLETNVHEYKARALDGYKMCWDTFHVQRPARNGAPGIEDWRKLFEVLPADSVRLIHVHLVQKQLADFWDGNGILIDMLIALRVKFPKVPAIIEVFPPLRSPGKTVEYLSRLRERVYRLLG